MRETIEQLNTRRRREIHCSLVSAYPRGQRVELRPHLDAWMRGDRFGTVSRVGKRNLRIYVRMDKTGRELSLLPENLTDVYTSAHDRAQFAAQLPAQDGAK